MRLAKGESDNFTWKDLQLLGTKFKEYRGN